MATLFPGMSDAEQHQAVNILKQFTSVIAERFGTDDPLLDSQYISGVKPVEIIPLSPTDGENIGNGMMLDSSLPYDEASICQVTEQNVALKREYVLSDHTDNSDINTQYYNLTVRDADGSERVILLKKDDVKVDQEGNLIINEEEVKTALAEFVECEMESHHKTLPLDSECLDDNKRCAEQTLNNGEEELVPSNPATCATSGERKDPVNETEDCESSKNINSDGVRANSMNSLENNGLISGENPCAQLTPQPRVISPIVNVVENGSVSPGLGETVVGKRKRGRPKGSKKGQWSKEKTVCSVCGKQLNNTSNLTGKTMTYQLISVIKVLPILIIIIQCHYYLLSV